MKLKLVLSIAVFAQLVMASPCETIAKNVRSHEYPALVPMHFVNTGKTAVDIKWISYENREVMYQTLEAGKAYTQYTFPSHPWVVRKNNECVGVFYPDGQARTVIIGKGKTNTIISGASSSQQSSEDAEGRLLPPR